MEETHKLYYSISEVADELEVSMPTLRFWESEFKQIKPYKNKRGVRFYTKNDIALLKEIHYLTKTCGYTLEGAKNYLKQQRLAQTSSGNKKQENPNVETVRSLQEVKDFLLDLKETL
jgi:Predicted transcriptional regulators